MASATYVSVILSYSGSNVGLWRCRVVGPEGDTGDFRLDEPRSFCHSEPAEVLRKLADANALAADLLSRAAAGGDPIMFREDDVNWMQVEYPIQASHGL